MNIRPRRHGLMGPCHILIKSGLASNSYFLPDRLPEAQFAISDLVRRCTENCGDDRLSPGGQACQARVEPPCFLAGFLLAAATQAADQPLPQGITAEVLAKDNNLFLTVAKKALHWEEPVEPIKIVGPIYFVGTRGLGVFLFTTPEGHILMNTGMPSSGPMIVDSIKKLGFKSEDIKIMINGHAHIDHAGAFAFLKQQIPGAQLAVMREDVPAMESGDKSDFKYGDDFVYPPVKVDRTLRDGDTIKIGDVVLTAYLTPGHTRGATTWVANIVDGGNAYVVAFPDGAGFNPGYRR
jgi:metallo-beta-lactamase class B